MASVLTVAVHLSANIPGPCSMASIPMQPLKTRESRGLNVYDGSSSSEGFDGSTGFGFEEGLWSNKAAS